MYEIIVTEQAKSQLARLDSFSRERIGAALERIKIRPQDFVKKMYNSKYYQARVDNFRIILDIKDIQLILYVVEIGSRDRIYKS